MKHRALPSPDAAEGPMELDSNGHPVLPPVPPRSFLDNVKRFYFQYVILPILGPVLVGSFLLINKNQCRQSMIQTFRLLHSIGSVRARDFQPTVMLKRMWQTPSAQHYVQNAALMGQKQEGYCGRTTLRCILKSFGCSTLELPPDMRGETKPEKFCSHIEELAPKRLNLTTEIVSGSVDFPTFVKTLRKVNDTNCRIAINYLRSALFGFQFPWFFPTNFFLGMFGGHFSPVVGVMEGEHQHDPLVAVFDVNHNYGGAYLVPASRLYGSVAAVDVTSGKHRALIVITSSPHIN